MVNLLAVQCHLAGAGGGAILRARQGAEPEVLAVYPPLAEGATPPVWIAQAAEAAPQVTVAGATTVKPVHGPSDLYGQETGKHLVMVPLRTGQGVRGLGAFVVETRNAAALEASCERLEITVSLLSLYEMRLTLQRRNLDMQRLRLAMETLSAVNEHNRFAGAGMAICNEVASRWGAERVGLGFLKRRYVHLKALSHTEKFNRRMKLVQDIEGAMEECLDQDVEILHPSSPEATYVDRAAAQLSKRHGPSNILSVPLRRDGEVEGVLTLERPADSPFEIEEIEALRLVGELTTARLVTLHRTDRWFGARFAGWARKGISSFLGPKHTWLKVAAILIFGAAIFLTFAKGQYKAEAPFVVQATERKVVPAPFDGIIDVILVKPGDNVKVGQELARMDTKDLHNRLRKARVARLAAKEKADGHLSKGETAEYNMAMREAEGAQIEARLLQDYMDRAVLTAKVGGIILSIPGDLEWKIGAPIKTGEVMFEIAPLSSLRVEISVAEDQIADVRRAYVDAKNDRERVPGELAAVGVPEMTIDFEVDRINPIAEVVDQKNVFKVRADFVDLDLADKHRWMRPGMEGSAKISIRRERYAWIWTRKMANWVRMKIWW